MHMELQYSDLEERYRTRVLHAQQAEDQQLYSTELEGAMMVRQQWAGLQAEAERVDAELEDIKFQFSHITKQQVSQLASPDVCSSRLPTLRWLASLKRRQGSTDVHHDVQPALAATPRVLQASGGKANVAWNSNAS
jgi:hypothetical protein